MLSLQTQGEGSLFGWLPRMNVCWKQWGETRGPSPGPIPEPAPREKDPDQIIFVCVLAAGRKEGVDN